MGYYTRYTLETLEEPGLVPFKAALEGIAGGYTLDLGDESDSWKWYEHEEHIVAAMRASGATLVELHGEGEEQGDVWDKVFKVEDDGSVSVSVFRHQLVRPEAPTTRTTHRGQK